MLGVSARDGGPISQVSSRRSISWIVGPPHAEAAAAEEEAEGGAAAEARAGPGRRTDS